MIVSRTIDHRESGGTARVRHECVVEHDGVVHKFIFDGELTSDSDMIDYEMWKIGVEEFIETGRM